MTQHELFQHIDAQIQWDGRQLAGYLARLRTVIDQRASQLMDAVILLQTTENFIDLTARAQAHEAAAAEQRRWLYQRDRDHSWTA